MQGDGLAISDVWLYVVRIFLLPGDGAIGLLLTHAPALARFLDIDAGSYGGAAAAIVSAIVWLAALVLAGVLYGRIVDFDRALTASVKSWYGEWLRRARVARRLIGCELRRLGSRLRAGRAARRPETVDLGELVLSDLEIEALRSHALLAPGYVMSATDLAGSLEIRRSQASQLLGKLEKLALLKRSFSTDDDESGYRLSGSGHFVLMATERRSGEC